MPGSRIPASLTATEPFSETPATFREGCQTNLPAGFFAIYHALKEHNRRTTLGPTTPAPSPSSSLEVVATIEPQMDVSAFSNRLKKESPRQHRQPVHGSAPANDSR